jgi:hypothetical protein
MKVIASVLNVRSGPSTEFAVVGQLTRNNIVRVVESSGEWVRIEGACGWVSKQFLTPVAKRAPSGLVEIRERFGEPGNPLASAGRVVLPEPLKLGWADARVSRVACHVHMEEAFASVLGAIHTVGLWPAIKTFDGIYNDRTTRGGTKKSTHSWGIAIDLNAATNRMGTRGDMDPRIVRIFEEHGFFWGGRWAGKSIDPMHFQFATDY